MVRTWVPSIVSEKTTGGATLASAAFIELTMDRRLGNLVTIDFPPTVPEDTVGCDGKTSRFASSEERGFFLMYGPVQTQ